MSNSINSTALLLVLFRYFTRGVDELPVLRPAFTFYGFSFQFRRSTVEANTNGSFLSLLASFHMRGQFQGSILLRIFRLRCHSRIVLYLGKPMVFKSLPLCHNPVAELNVGLAPIELPDLK